MKATKLIPLIPLAFASCTDFTENSILLQGKYITDTKDTNHQAQGISNYNNIIPDENKIQYFHIKEIPRVIIPEEMIDFEAECTGDMIQEKDCEANNPCQGYMVRECDDEQWGPWSECFPWKQLTNENIYFGPKVSEEKIAYLGVNGDFNKDIFIYDTKTETTELIPQQAAIVNIYNQYLGLIHAGKVGDCSIVDIGTKETVYTNLCPTDIQNNLLVVSETKNDIIAMDFLTFETSEIAVAPYHFEPKISGDNVVFYTREEKKGFGKAHIWNLPTFDNHQLNYDGQGNDKHILIEGNTALWSNYLGDEVRLLKYDIQNDTISEIFTKNTKNNNCSNFTQYNGFLNLAGFNGKSLVYKTYNLFDCQSLENMCKCSHSWDLRLYDFENNTEEIIITDVISGLKHKPLTQPSLSGKDLVFGKGGNIFHCQLKDQYLNLPDLKINELEALPNIFELGKEVNVQFQVVNIGDILINKPFNIDVQACTPDKKYCGEPQSIQLPGIGLEAIVTGLTFIPDEYTDYTTHIKVIVDSTNAIVEKDETNNENGSEFYFLNIY
jgi:hypothetical protein